MVMKGHHRKREATCYGVDVNRNESESVGCALEVDKTRKKEGADTAMSFFKSRCTYKYEFY
jgi:hypothetical protein